MLISTGLHQGGLPQTNSVVWHKASILPSEGKTPYVNFWSKLRYCHFWDKVALLYHVMRYFESIMSFLDRKLSLNIILT